MRLSYPLCALCLTAACASDSPTGHPKGVLTDATMNTVTIVTEKNDTLQFSTEQADRTEVDGLLLGDTVEVFFQGKYRRTTTLPCGNASLTTERRHSIS